MYKIGEFARAGNVTVKTLRHYAQIGLLRPGWVDRFTGYRYYTDEQLSRLNRILALKDLGFSLKQVGLLLDNDLQIDKLRAMLTMKQRELSQLVQVEQHRLEQVEERLRQIEQEGHSPLVPSGIIKETIMELKLVTRPSFTVVGMLYVGKNQNNEIPEMWTKFNKRGNELVCKGDAAYGVCQWVNGGSDGVFEYLAGYEVDPNDPIPEGMVARTVPASTWAVFEHRGAADTLGDTYNRIYQEILPASNYRQTEDGRDMEVYTDEFTFFAPDSIMYIYVPVIPR
jgi:predicted transcriptional regulator YdeE